MNDIYELVKEHLSTIDKMSKEHSTKSNVSDKNTLKRPTKLRPKEKANPKSPKFLNWGALTDDILEILVMNQTTLSKMCKVTQQSISNWKTGTRNPGLYARSILRDLALNAKLDIDDYLLVVNNKISKEREPYMICPKVLELTQRMAKLPRKQQMDIMEMAEFMIKRG